jgi:hypothetical protein
MLRFCRVSLPREPGSEPVADDMVPVLLKCNDGWRACPPGFSSKLARVAPDFD